MTSLVRLDYHPPLSGIERETDAIFEQLATQMPGYGVGRYLERRTNAIHECSNVVIARERDRVVGLFSGARHTVVDFDYYFIDTAFLSPQYQGSYLLGRMLMCLAARAFSSAADYPDYFVMTKFNPSSYYPIWGFARAGGLAIYPDVGKTCQDAGLARIAEAILERHRPGAVLEPDAGVFTRAAGHPIEPEFYPRPPRSKRAEVNEYFDRHLTVDKRLVCVLRTQEPSEKRRIERTFARRRAPAPSPTG